MCLLHSNIRRAFGAWRPGYFNSGPFSQSWRPKPNPPPGGKNQSVNLPPRKEKKYFLPTTPWAGLHSSNGMPQGPPHGQLCLLTVSCFGGKSPPVWHSTKCSTSRPEGVATSNIRRTALVFGPGDVRGAHQPVQKTVFSPCQPGIIPLVNEMACSEQPQQSGTMSPKKANTRHSRGGGRCNTDPRKTTHKNTKKNTKKECKLHENSV